MHTDLGWPGQVGSKQYNVMQCNAWEQLMEKRCVLHTCTLQKVKPAGRAK